MKLPETISITYKATDEYNTAKQWFEDIDKNYSIVGVDFEAAVRYSDEEIAEAKSELELTNPEFYKRLELQQIINATALSHPSKAFPTHLSIGLSETEAKVVIIHTYELLYLVMDWLTTTEVTQIWHNASFDFKHIYHHTQKFPKNYEDTQILAKTVLNHVEVYKAKTGLKELMSEEYGAWATSKDNFTVSEMYEPYMLKYAATDGCAVVCLWNRVNSYLRDQD